MITSGVNFLSFGRRKKILRRTHKKYSLLIGVFIVIIIFLVNNISSEYRIIDKSVQVYSEIDEGFLPNTSSLDSINFLVNEMGLHIENISYQNNESLKIKVRLADKKKIYDIVDNLDRNSFSVNSYTHILEEKGQFIYNIEIGV